VTRDDGRSTFWTMRRLLTVALVAATAGAPAVAANAALKPLAQRIVAAGAPGAVVYSRTPTAVHAVAAGHADVTKKTRLTPGMSFRVGSITKSFVSVMVLQLVAEGMLKLDDTVEQWLPGALPNGTAITLRHLLNHTSGVPNYLDNESLLHAMNANKKRAWTPLELLAYAAGPPEFAPGSSFAYSNTNYLVLGLIVEAATGHPLAAELQTRILTPLQLGHTTFPASTVMPPPFAHGYAPGVNGRRVDVSAWHPSYAWAAGALVSTADDLARFYSALLSGRLLAQPQQAELLRTSGVGEGRDYALGIFEKRFRCGIGWGHNGGLPGYTSIAFASPDGSRVAVVLVNDSISRAREVVARDNAITGAFCAG